jgi:hypothetical protein
MEICLFTKDPQKDFKEMLKKRGITRISKVSLVYIDVFYQHIPTRVFRRLSVSRNCVPSTSLLKLSVSFALHTECFWPMIASFLSSLNWLANHSLRRKSKRVPLFSTYIPNVLTMFSLGNQLLSTWEQRIWKRKLLKLSIPRISFIAEDAACKSCFTIIWPNLFSPLL